MSTGFTPSRREMLASMLGVGASLAACRRAPTWEFEGEIVGGSAELGHRLREPDALAGARVASEPERRAVVIAGAGPSGLAAAWRLARAGLTDYEVLELEPEAGGTSRAGRNRVSPYPWGAHYVPLPLASNRALVRVLGELGVLDGTDEHGDPVAVEEALVRDLDERVFFRGAWREGLYPREGATPEDLAQLRAFGQEVDRYVGMRDARGRRAFALPSSQSSDDASVMTLDRITMDAWMRERGFTSARLRWLVDYACRDDYGMRSADTSAWAGIFYFASRVARPGAQPQELIAWPEGNGRLARHLASASGERVRTGQLVADIAPREGSVRVRALDARTRRVREIDAEQVIVALPKFVARRVVAPLRGEQGAHLDAFTYAPWVVANVTLRARPREAGVLMAWDNVLYDSPALGYVAATHQSLRDHGPTVLTYYYPMTGSDPRRERTRALALSWREWSDVVLSDLSRAHPDLPGLVERLDVYRWGHGMARPVPGFISSEARRRAALPIEDRVFFAHSDLSGIALFEEALDRGVAAAEDVMRARGIAHESVR